MAEPFLGEIKYFAFGYAPRNWAPCDGQIMAISQNQALFALLGSAFGGDGVTTFALPDLRGRTAMHPGTNLPQGAMGGVENVTLTPNSIPTHNHQVMVASKSPGSIEEFKDSVIGEGALGSELTNVYAPASAGRLQPLTPKMVQPTGGGQPHSNMQPSLVGNFCIALAGVYPSHG